MKHFLILVAVCCSFPAWSAVKLTTLPERERTAIRFEDNGHVLVSESRTLTLQQGANTIDFTWVGVQVDRGSIQLRGVDGVDFNVIRTAYPPGQGNTLVWHVSAAAAGSAEVRIDYLLMGLSRELSWRAVVGEDESHLDLQLQGRLQNASGETFDEASLRLAFGELRPSPLQNGEIRQQVAARFGDVPFLKRYTYDPRRFGEQVAVHYVLTNDAEHGLGVGTLPAGKVRIYQTTPQNEAFLGEDWARDTALNDEMELRIGSAQDITVRRVQMNSEQEVLRYGSGRRPALWNTHRTIRIEVENFTDEVKEVKLVEYMDQHTEWTVESVEQILERRTAPEEYETVEGEVNPPADLKRRDVGHLDITVDVPPERRVALVVHETFLNQHRSR